MGVNSRNIFLAGATGLVGGLVLRDLLANRGFTGTIFAPSRRETGVSDSRLVAPVIDLSPARAVLAIEALQRYVTEPLDTYVCCLGTTIRSAGSREAFIAVDRELALRLAQFAFERGARHAILVSSTGASRQSANFYLRVKGEVEDAMARLGFDRLDVIRPGLLLGERSQRRPTESLAQLVAPLANAALVGRFKSYRAIPAETVSLAIARLAFSPAGEGAVHSHDSLVALAAS